MKGDDPQEQPHQSGEANRFCRRPDCSTRLSAHNPGDTCFCHDRDDSPEEGMMAPPIPLDEIEAALRSGGKSSLKLLELLQHMENLMPETVEDPRLGTLTLDTIIEAVSGACKTAKEKILSREQVHRTVLARRVAIYLLHYELGMQIGEMSGLFHQPLHYTQQLLQKARREIRSKPLFRILVKATALRYGSRLPSSNNYKSDLSGNAGVLLHSVADQSEEMVKPVMAIEETPDTGTANKQTEGREDVMSRTIEELIRKAAQQWVERASLAELASCVPGDALLSLISANGTGGAAVASTPAHSARETAKPRRLTHTEGNLIRSKLIGLDPASPEYERGVEALVQAGFSKSQILGAVRRAKSV